VEAATDCRFARIDEERTVDPNGAQRGATERRAVVSVNVAKGQPIDSGLTVDIMGVPVDDVTLEEALALIARFVEIGRRFGTTFQIATVNVDFVVNAQQHPDLKKILRSAELCLADGVPVLWYARLSGTPLRERVAGADLVPALIAQSAQIGTRVLLFGSAPGVAEAARTALRVRFPGAHVEGVSGPMLADVEEMDPAYIALIRQLRPDVICVALGNPKQERWISRFREELGVPVLIGVGGTLDFLVGGRRRAPAWMQRRGLEWLYRSAQEPMRLGRRYARDARIFLPGLLGAFRSRERPLRCTVRHSGVGSIASGVIDARQSELTKRRLWTIVGLARRARRANERLVVITVDESLISQTEQLVADAVDFAAGADPISGAASVRISTMRAETDTCHG
jgi:exopolysaccharide biosynthesis WecB/TagA/CpsF family protein